MVVQRKTPGAPGAPAASRSSSTQALPKTSKDPLSPPRVTPPTVDDVKSRNKHHKKSKLHEVTQTSSISSAAKKVKKSWLPTRFFILLLTIFSIYSLSTCPHDYHRVSPICRSLDVYKNTILEPYLVPSLRHLSHLAEPYTEPLKPYTDPVKEFAETQVVPRVRFVKERVIEDRAIPFYKEYVVQRLFKGYLKPTWRKHVQPHLEPYLAPIKAQYQKHVLPIWHTTQKHVTLYYKQAQPYIDSAIQHGQTTYVYVRYHSQRTWRVVKPRIIQSYAYTKPRAIKAWKQAKPYLCRAVAEVKSKAGDAGRFLGQHRRTYVDPHVRRIWEKVVEPSNGTRGTVGNVQAEETPEAVPTTQSIQETEEVIQTTPAASPIPVQTPEPEQETVAANADEPEEPSTPAPAATAEAPLAEQVQVEEVVAPELSEPAAHVPVTEEAAASAASIVAESLHPESTPIAGVSAEPTEGFPEDVDDFLKDLGFGDEDDLSAPPSYSEEADEAVFTPAEELLEADSSEAASSSKMPPAEPTGQPSFNQEPSPEEKLRLTAQKREEIVTRHERHEKELKEFVETMEKEAREVLAAARDEGVHGLLTWSSEDELNGQGKGVMKEIEEETSKFMKGLEGYVRSSEKRLNHLVTSGGSADSVRKAVKSEKIKFDNVLSKTHAKFSERLQAMQLKVGQFVQDVRGKEKEEIDSRSKEVMKMAEEAQGDLALDYAWLDDVSYWDWQRYHDLVRVAENFTALLNALHSNDHDSLSSYHLSTPLPDPLVDTLMTLEQEVQEVVDGFEVWVEGITRKGKEAMQGFADRLPAETTPAATTATPEKQKTVRFGHAVPSAKGRASILPIAPSDPGSVPTQTGTPELDENAQHIFLSRSKEEVEERVKGLNVDREEL